MRKVKDDHYSYMILQRMPGQAPLPLDRGPKNKSDIAARRRQYQLLGSAQRASSSKNQRTNAKTRQPSSSPEEDEENLESLLWGFFVILGE
jgi:hypothetical protein